MASAVRQGWRGAVSKHCSAEPVQGRMLRLSNISQNVLPVANALEPRNLSVQFILVILQTGMFFTNLCFSAEKG